MTLVVPVSRLFEAWVARAPLGGGFRVRKAAADESLWAIWDGLERAREGLAHRPSVFRAVQAGPLPRFRLFGQALVLGRRRLS